jgi:hypothetical protein
MAFVEVLSTVRIGQLTGSTRSQEPRWIRSVDPVQWPLLNETGRWGVMGLDLGANTEHSDKKLYFFFGDVAVEWDPRFPGFSGDGPIVENSDLVAWTDDTDILTHGGHLAIGWNFFLPNDEQGANEHIGQPDWRFCVRCGGLFWAPKGSTFGSVCPKGGEHNHGGVGLTFFLPNDHQQANESTGQPNWRFCQNCHGLFWAPNKQPAGACPIGDKHVPQGWFFFLPNQPSDPDVPEELPGPIPPTGQPRWRFCANCHGLFWDGSAFKGLCPGAPGGGFHLHAVERKQGRFKGKFAPLNAEDPIGFTSTFETPSGAFSYNGRVYVFVGISETIHSHRVRFGDPAYGLYLVSNNAPGVCGEMIDDIHPAATYRKEFLFSPRMGCCPKDANRTLFESHEILGLKFILPQIAVGTSDNLNTWCACRKCEAIFLNDGANGVCWKGGMHEADGTVYALVPGTVEDAHHQGNWRRCWDCGMLFWDGDDAQKGLCPAGGNHRGSDPPFLIPHFSEAEDQHNNGNWRFCIKCRGMVRSNQMDVFPGVTAWVVENAKHDLPEREGLGVVMMTRNWKRDDFEPGFRLAWMPLKASDGPHLEDVLYYTGEPDRWSPDPLQAKLLFKHPTNFYTSLSLAWLDGPQCWLLLYSEANPDTKNPGDLTRPIVGCISRSLFEWSEPFKIFKPLDAGAYGLGNYMHWPQQAALLITNPPVPDNMHLDIPPLPPFERDSKTIRENKAGCAYGAFILNRFTKWDQEARILDIYFLLSTGRPYQVHLMHSQMLVSG